VYSYTVVHNAPPDFQSDAPYVVALVDLEEGPRMMTRLIDCERERLQVGLAVEVVFLPAENDLVLPFFRPAASAPGAGQ
jgi:uncharacterized OB-fold protein